jgi:hypothetical protein
MTRQVTDVNYSKSAGRGLEDRNDVDVFLLSSSLTVLEPGAVLASSHTQSIFSLKFDDDEIACVNARFSTTEGHDTYFDFLLPFFALTVRSNDVNHHHE